MDACAIATDFPFLKWPSPSTSDKPTIAYLCYRDFDEDPHPQLRERFLADLETLRTYHRDYTQTNDPPLLHRKESFVSDTCPRRAEFAALTLAEVEAGLLSDAAEIGTARAWKQRLAAAGLTIVGRELMQVSPSWPESPSVLLGRRGQHRASS